MSDVVDKALAWGEIAKKNAEIVQLKRDLAFVALWCYRESKNLSDSERFGAIKYHPAVKAAAREAGLCT